MSFLKLLLKPGPFRRSIFFTLALVATLATNPAHAGTPLQNAFDALPQIDSVQVCEQKLSSPTTNAETINEIAAYLKKGHDAQAPFIALAKQLQTESDGRAINNDEYQAALVPFNKLLIHYREMAVLAAEGCSQLVAHELQELSRRSEPSDRKIILTRILKLIATANTVDANLRAQYNALFEITPSSREPEHNRVAGRWAALEKEPLLAELKQIREQLNGLFVEKAAAPTTKTISLEEVIHYYQTELRRLPNQNFVGLFKEILNTEFNSETYVDLFYKNPKLQLALGFYIRGLDEAGHSHVQQFFSEFEAQKGKPLSQEAKTRLGTMLVKASKNPELARAYALMANKNLPIELLMFANFTKTEATIDVPKFGEMPAMNVRSQQLMMARAVLQYGNLTDHSSALEIGYGTPSILAALKPVAPRAVVGVDLFEFPATAREALRGSVDDLIVGNAPSDANAALRIAKHGKFTVIYGLDVFKETVGFGRSFEASVSNLDYLRWVHLQLEEGGTFIAMNDFEKPWVFSKEEVIQAGFEIVRWNAPRELTKGDKLFALETQDRMSLYVLRKGKVDLTRFMQKTQSSSP